MALSVRRTKKYSAKAYLDLEETATHKSEFYDGVIYAMAGGSFNHDMISGNVYAALHEFARTGSCIAFTSNMKLRIEAHNLYLYPDAMLICGAPKFEKNRTDAVLNPLLLVEVLSKSTENYDRGKKFEYYRSLPTFQEYLLIDQERVYVEHYQRLHIGRWHYGILTDLDETIKLQSISLTIPVRRLYEQVDWLRQESTEEEPYGKTH
jgi:Uma2 family endonuclease